MLQGGVGPGEILFCEQKRRPFYGSRDVTRQYRWVLSDVPSTISCLVPHPASR